MIFSVQRRVDWGPVEGLQVGRFNFGVNTLFTVYRIGSTLIDAGPPNRWPQIRNFAGQRRLETVLLTHHHEDHSGNAAWLQRYFQAQVLAPQLSLGLLRDGFPIQFYRRQVWGVPPRFEAEALPERWEDPAGYHWQVISTPGHADDMVCLYEPNQGWLFSADLYVASRVRYGRREDRLDQEIQSLQTCSKLDFGQLFCSHRGPISNGPHALKSKLDYLVSLRQQVRQLHASGLSIGQIQRRLLGREDFVSYLSGFHFCKAHLIRACLPADKEEGSRHA